MYKNTAAVLLAAGLIISPLPALIHGASAQSAPSTADKKASAKKGATSNQLALRERQKKCGAEWKAAKKDGKMDKGMKWPQYWSACNKRLKASG